MFNLTINKMKNKVLFGMFAAAGMLLATSCQNEKLEPVQADTESVVSFTLEQPGIATRAYSDGLTATTLTYAVYDAGTKNLITKSEDEVTFTNKTATVNLRLVTGKSYDILFWADAPDAPYTFDEAAQTITVDYTGIASGEEARDAFFAAEKNLLVDGAITKEVTLYRPFAQLNIGTTDADEPAVVAFAPTQSKVTVKNVYSTLDLYSEAVADPVEMTYAMANIPGETETFPVAGVKYLSMNYLLVANEKELMDVEFIVTNGSHEITREYASVPVQRNFRTNIYGKLLTDPVDFTIKIESQYETPDHEVVIWDGKTTTEPASNDTEWTVTTAAEWIYLKNNGVNGKNIKLGANIDFGGHEVKGLAFDGEFDGQGFTMSNMTLLCGGSYYSNGLFQGDASGSVTVKNVTIENVTAECSNPDQGYVGTIFGDVQNGTVTLSGVHVKNANLCGVQSVGGLVGFVGSGATLNVDDCTVDGSVISNYPVNNESGFVAGLVGRPVGTVNVTNSTVTNTTIDAYYAPRRGEASVQAVVGNNTELTANSDVKVIKKILLESGVELNGTIYETLAEALAAAIDNDVLNIAAGTYEVPAGGNNKTLKLVGADAAKVTFKLRPNGDAHHDGAFSGSKITFENLTIEADPSQTQYSGYGHCEGTYKDCIIKNVYTLYGTSIFEDCTFEVTGDRYNVWTWGASATFNNCVFNCDGKAVLVYGETAQSTITFNTCIFNDNGDGTVSGKAAIEVGAYNYAKYDIYINDCTANGFDINTVGVSTGTTLWGNKNSMEADKLNVVIDGVDVL